ncbi:MAG: endo alpha-1,4 polygalactosaminidase [Magnetococcales bacterium]|nr:endo alpha-1,4 polygalactosaminidase [Magnetococcales bacterium]MBF0151689.1 endo alpha-1,4 polygalactosaminidase [Magnetococcales bacterium]
MHTTISRNILLWISLVLVFFHRATPLHAESWVVYYSDKEPETRFESYSLLVFDSQYHPPLERLKERGKIILGYLSLGEVENHRRHFSTVTEQKLLLMENEDWPGSYFIDVRNPVWTELVIEVLIPELLQQGFHGLFIDTLDNPGYLEDLDPKRYRGMRQGGIHLVKAIRRHYPELPIMINRGFDLLDHLIYDVDMILAESTRSQPDPDGKGHHLTPDAEYEATAAKLRRFKEIRPRLKLYSLDYWDPTDAKGQALIYRQQREHGFIPYVSTIELNQVFPEPSP